MKVTNINGIALKLSSYLLLLSTFCPIWTCSLWLSERLPLAGSNLLITTPPDALPP